MKNRKITLENGITIEGATLLTIEEAEKLTKETLSIGCWWWLRSPGGSGDGAASVFSDGSVYYNGFYVYFDFGAVRPALIISNLKSSDLKIGDRFQFGNRTFEIISADRALCTESIGECAFREDWESADANDYEVSDVKRFIDDWYENILQSYLSGYNKAVEDKSGKI